MRIGVDRLAGAATGGLDDVAGELKRASYPRVDFAGTKSSIGDGDVILDVRRDDEYAAGHVVDSVHLHLADLVERMDELPGRLWVHCASGFRASIAASLIDRAGRDVVYIDDDYENAAPAGLPVT